MRQPTQRQSTPHAAPARGVGRVLLATLLGLALSVTMAPGALAGDYDDPAVEAEAMRHLERLETTAAPLPPRKCTKAGKRAGWKRANLVLATAISLAESGCNPTATGTNPPTAGCPDGSRDRGAWQINDCYHPNVSDACAYELRCNANAAYQIWLDRDRTFQPWTTYNTRAFKFHLQEARRAVSRITGRNIVLGVITTDGGPLNVRNRPRTSGTVVGQLADDAIVRIRCQTRGEQVWSPIFEEYTRTWDSHRRGKYFSDGYVHTDAQGRIAPRC